MTFVITISTIVNMKYLKAHQLIHAGIKSQQ